MAKYKTNDIVMVAFDGNESTGKILSVDTYPDGVYYDLETQEMLLKGVSEKDIVEVYKVIIAGGRYFNDYELLKEKCDYYLQNKLREGRVVIISGHATGADSLGERYASEQGLKTELHPADWKAHGKAAGPIRNKEMAEVADALIAFWDGQSRGTANMISIAKSKGLKVAVVKY